jgi:hypothetical protein
MPRYIFVYDERDNSFPERYRVVRPDEDAEVLRDAENLTGTVSEAAAVEFLEDLFKRCPSDAPVRGDLVDAVDWKIVELSYAAGPKTG